MLTVPVAILTDRDRPDPRSKLSHAHREGRELLMRTPIGIPWYRREAYPELRKLFVDGDRLPRDYDQWLASATQGFAQVQAQGGLALKVYLDPRHFRFWCQERRLEPDFRARQQFVMAIAQDHALSAPTMAML
jgi:hypothetical protein